MVSQTRPSGQIFGLTQTVGYVEGRVLRYTLNEDGSFSAADEPLDALSTQELETLAVHLEADLTEEETRLRKAYIVNPALYNS